MLSSDLIFIIGRQRSGTTVFRDLLVRHGAVNCDEIFHGDLSRPHRFFAFVLERVKEVPMLVHPQHLPRLFKQYVEHERQLAGGERLVLDVKYFGINLIPNFEDVDNHTPFIVNFMRSSMAEVVHIIRRNKLRVFVSEAISQATGRWSAEKVEHFVSGKKKIFLDMDQVLSSVNRLIEQDRRVCALLEKIPNLSRLYYDEMFDPMGLFSKSAQSVAVKVLDVVQVDPTPGNLRMNPESLFDLVTNYDELVQVFRASPHAWMLDDRN